MLINMFTRFSLRIEVSFMKFAVEARNVVKDFGEIRALDGLSFNVRQGEIYGLIGPNGAGKTTALRIASTLLLPTSGAIKVFDHDVVDEALEVRRLISYLPEEFLFPHENYLIHHEVSQGFFKPTGCYWT
jgi:ABC-type multidrug transport system ATPase subunit